MPLLILCSRLFVKILSNIRVVVEEVMRVGLEIRGNILLDNIRLVRLRVNNIDTEITHEIRKFISKLMVDKMLSRELLKI